MSIKGSLQSTKAANLGRKNGKGFEAVPVVIPPYNSRG